MKFEGFIPSKLLWKSKRKCVKKLLVSYIVKFKLVTYIVSF